MTDDTLHINVGRQELLNPNFFEHVHGGDYEFSTHIFSERAALVVFLKMDERLGDMLTHASNAGDVAAEDSFWFVTSLFQIAKRELRNAFWLVLRRMSYDGMLLLRVALESTKFGYLIHDNPALATIWANKMTDGKAYKRAFRFADPPASMPFGKEIQQHIEDIGEFWGHPHIGYFSTTVRMKEQECQVHSLDPDPKSYYLCLKTVLQAQLMCLSVLGKAFEARFPVYQSSHQQDLARLHDEYAAVERHYLTLAEAPNPHWKTSS